MDEEELTSEQQRKVDMGYHKDEEMCVINDQPSNKRPWYKFHTSINDPDFVSYGNDGLNRGNSNNRRS